MPNGSRTAGELADRRSAARQVNPRPQPLPFGVRALQRDGDGPFACATARAGRFWTDAARAPGWELRGCLRGGAAQFDCRSSLALFACSRHRRACLHLLDVGAYFIQVEPGLASHVGRKAPRGRRSRCSRPHAHAFLAVTTRLEATPRLQRKEADGDSCHICSGVARVAPSRCGGRDSARKSNFPDQRLHLRPCQLRYPGRRTACIRSQQRDPPHRVRPVSRC